MMFNLEKCGSEFQIEGHTRGVQRQPQLAALAEGFVVAWTDDAAPTCEIGGPDVKAKLFNSTGEAIGRDFRVNTETIDHQRDPRIADFPNGGFVVVWQDFSGRGGDACGSSIKAKLFNAAGVVVKDEFLVNVETSSRQFNADVASLPGGDFVVVWQCHGGGEDWDDCIKARLFDRDGVPAGDEILVSIWPQKSHSRPSVARFGDRGFVVVWSNLFSNMSSINAVIFGADGTVVREEFLVSSRTLNRSLAATVAGLEDGGFVIAWTDQDTSKDADASDIWMRVFDEQGSSIGQELAIGAQAISRPLCPALAALAGGGFVLVWSDRHDLEDEPAAIKASTFGPKGISVVADIVVGRRSESGVSSPAVAGLPNGGFVVAWEDASGRSDGEVAVKAQIFQPTKMGGLGSLRIAQPELA